jgi:cold shock protein
MVDRQVGKVRFWHEAKGFGFILPDGAFESVFVHFSQIRKTGLTQLPQGQRVSFDVGPAKDGRTMAVNVELA